MVSALQNGNRNGCEVGFVVRKPDLEGQKRSSVWKGQGHGD